MARNVTGKRYAVCIRNRGHRASLVVRRLYELLPDQEAEEHGLLRIVDESGEDYLYPAQMFVALELPRPVQRAIAGAR